MRTPKLKISLKDWQEDTASLAAFHEFAYLKIYMLAVESEDYFGFKINTLELADIVKVKIGLLNSTLESLNQAGLIEFNYDSSGGVLITCNRVKHIGELREKRAEAGRKGGTISRKGTKSLKVKFGSDIKIVKIVSSHIGEVRINGEVANNVGEQISSPDSEKKAPKEPKINPRKPVDEELLSQVISYLNMQSGRDVRTTNLTTIKNFNARVKDGFSIEDFQRVIDHKVKDWRGTEYEKYLNPETLFGNKFESYLNAAPTIKTQTELLSQSQSTMSPEQYNSYIRGDYNPTQ